MSLSDAVLSVAEAMEVEAKAIIQQQGGGSMTTILLTSFVRELRTAVKAAEGSEPKPATSSTKFDHLSAIEREREKIRAEKAGRGEGDSGPRSVFAEGGNSDGDSVVVDSAMPVGAKTVVMGQVYVLTSENTLRFDEAETGRLGDRLFASTGAKPKVELG